ncbi:MAG: ABC transporter ATP-binding protein [Erysipelotrichaceae bacterium]|nr:ABC transporter ATP-binding protein [Erysipelotrichaceae bacterium]
MQILEIKNLTKYYGNILGVESLSLSLEEGEVFGFIGPNGAGKSTTIRSIMNLVNKNEGTILIEGQEFKKDDRKMKERIGYLPSEIHLYDDFTVKEMLDYHESFYQKEIHNRRRKLVKRLKIDETKKIEDLSLGNLKKVGIVLALMHDPKLLILDEPTSGLDPLMQETFFDILKEEKQKGTTILYSTHILSEVSKICDRVGMIKEGHLLKVVTIKELHQKNFNFVTIESSEIEKIITKLKEEVIMREGNFVKIKNTLPPDQLIKLLGDYKLEKLLIEEATLEDLFFHDYK